MSHLILRHIPIDIIFGIDDFSINLTTKQSNIYIKDVSDGIHIIHFQEKDNGIRYGYWVRNVKNLYIQYIEQHEQFEIFSEMDQIKYETILNELEISNPYNVINFPKVTANFQIYNYLNWEDICQCLKIDKDENQFGYVDSSMITEYEQKLLSERLNRATSEYNEFDNNKENKIIRYTNINFKSRESIRVGYEMVDYLDKSYYLNEVIIASMSHGWISLLAELQFSFLNFVTMGNYGSSLQWHYIIELIVMSSRVENIKLVDEIVSAQLQMLPDEYSNMLLNVEMWARCFKGGQAQQQLVKTRSEIVKLYPEIQDDYVNGSSDVESADSVAYHNIDSDGDSDAPAVAESVSYFAPRT